MLSREEAQVLMAFDGHRLLKMYHLFFWAMMCQEEDLSCPSVTKTAFSLAFGLNEKMFELESSNMYFFRIFLNVPKVVAWSIQNDETGNILKPRGKVHIVQPGADSTPNRHSSSG